MQSLSHPHSKIVSVWGNKETENALGELIAVPQCVKKIHCDVLTQRGKAYSLPHSDSGSANYSGIVSTEITHKITARWESVKDITTDMWLIYGDKRMNIKYIDNKNSGNEWAEIYCIQQEVI